MGESIFPGDPSFDLSDGHIEVWCVETDAATNVIRQMEKVLAPEEISRAEQFHFEHHRNSFVVTRGMLRILLAHYLGEAAGDIIFAYGAKGKPSLPDAKIEFNISHTKGIALFAFALGCELGVDVEQIRPIQDMMQIARRFFSRQESEELLALLEEEKEKAFFRCWTRKEAYIKAVGEGLSIPLNAFRVTFKEEGPVRWIDLGNETSAQPTWALYNLDISSAYVAALAHRGSKRQIVQVGPLPANLLIDAALLS